MNLTEKSVLKLPVGKEREQIYDTEVTGFGVRVEPNGRKSFFWYAKINAIPRFRALGEFPAISVKEARDKARVWAGKGSHWKQNGYEGDDPFEKKRRSLPATTPLFRQLLEAYIAHHVRGTALHPARAEYDLRNLVKNHLSGWLDWPLDRISTEHVLEARNKVGRKYKYMANSIVETARKLFNWSAGKNDDGKLNFWKMENPAAEIKLYDKDKRKRFLQPDELVKFNKELKKEKHVDTRDAITLLLATGARKANVYEMEWRDVSFELRVWTVPRSKSGESYVVNLTPAALEVLERRRREIPESERWVFPASSATGHIADIKKRWKLFCKRAGFPDLRLHDLRRTRGSYLAIGGVSLQQIGEALGHKSLGSTQVYAQLHNQAIREALEVGDTTMERMMQSAKKRLKRRVRTAGPKLLAAVNRGV